jgi:hypothetical protein
MRRLIILITLTGFFFPMTELPKAAANHRPGPCSADRFHWWKAWREDRNVEPIKRIIRCAVFKWPVPGGSAKALSVARCESGFRPNALGFGNGGVYQHRLPYWAGRYEALTLRRWHLWPSVYNGRTNVIVSIRMAHAQGWGAWSCA